MQQSDIPAKFPIPFANNAGGAYVRNVPVGHQTATDDDAPASLYDGFPPETFEPLGSGGIPPSGADVNGILRALSAQVRWLMAGGAVPFDATWAASAAGGYPLGARVASASTPGVTWQSTVDNNTSNPDSGGGGWVRFTAGFEKTGQVRAAITHNQPYTITFDTPFPNACTNLQMTGYNASADIYRDVWPQIISYDRFGFTYMLQSSYGDPYNFHPNLDGIDWRASGN